MKVYDLIAVYADKVTANIVVIMGDDTIFEWDAIDNRHPDDGSYADVLNYIPNDIANAEVSYFTVIPTHMALHNEVVKLADVETLHITIPVYSNLYRYAYLPI